MLVAGEGGEAVDVLPHPLVRGVEQVGAVTVDLDAGLRLHLAVGVAADVVAPVQHQDPQAQAGCATLGHGQAEGACADDHQIRPSAGRRTGSAPAPLAAHGTAVPGAAAFLPGASGPLTEFTV
jgi:hypothetical protein